MVMNFIELAQIKGAQTNTWPLINRPPDKKQVLWPRVPDLLPACVACTGWEKCPSTVSSPVRVNSWGPIIHPHKNLSGTSVLCLARGIGRRQQLSDSPDYAPEDCTDEVVAAVQG